MRPLRPRSKSSFLNASRTCSAPFAAQEPLGFEGSRRLVQMKTCLSRWGMGSVFLPAQELARNDELLDLAGALVDAQGPHLAVELLDLDAAHHPEAAVELHRGVDDAEGRLGGEELRHGHGQLGVGR